MVWASYSQFQQAVRTRKNQFELDTASFNDKPEKPVLCWASFSQGGYSQAVRTRKFVCLCHAQPVSTTSQFELVSTTRKNQFWASQEPVSNKVWASYSQFQPAVRTRKNQFVCLCHAQQPVSTTSHNQFELVSTTRKNQFELVTTSFNHKKNQFELVTASFNKQWEPGRTSLS